MRSRGYARNGARVNRFLLAAGLLAIAPAALAQVPAQSPEFTAAQLSIANQMIDQQKLQILQIGAQVILLKQENDKLKAELEQAKKPAEAK